VKTKHNLEIGNMSGTYQLTIFYTDPRNPPVSFTNVTNVTVPTAAKSLSGGNKTNVTVPTAANSLSGRNTKSTNQLRNVVSSHTVQLTKRPDRIMQYINGRFTWPIKTMDLTTLTYFWIVLIGVTLSKLSTRISKGGEGKKSPIGNLSNYDYVWIGISAIIALLIFSSFQQQVHLTGNILYNISLAFAFGFGFDRILDTTSNLGSSKNT
jgi:hypothetical protein